jgi:exopolysaccharide biosynthesis polyprenyl glycosylphosphotransferase
VFDRRSKFLSLLTLLQDLAVICVAFGAAYLLRTLLIHFQFFHGQLPEIYPFSHYIPLLLAMLALWAITGYFGTFYRDLELGNPVRIAANLLYQALIVLVLAYAGLYLLKRTDISRTFVMVVGGVMFIALLTGRAVSYSAVDWMRERLNRYHYCVVVGCGSRAREVASLIEESRGSGLRLVGFVDPESDGTTRLKAIGKYQVHPLSSVEHILQNQVIDEVIFAVSMQELARLEPVILHCANLGIKVRMQLEFLPAAYSRVYLEKFHDLELLSLSSTPESELLLFLKRTFDVVLAACALVTLAPLMAGIALAIRLTSPGTVLFRQTRCGLGGRRFMLYKFRSMINNAEQLKAELHQFNDLNGIAFKLRDDPRITPVGRWLRRFSVDELPQLWNIVRGDMSFVGPRPAIPAEVDRYEPWQRRRLRMRPGLTCIWVLEGRNHLEFNRWIQLDLAYIDTWSLWLDAKIFFRTIPIVLSGRGAY